MIRHKRNTEAESLASGSEQLKLLVVLDYIIIVHNVHVTLHLYKLGNRMRNQGHIYRKIYFHTEITQTIVAHHSTLATA